MGERFYTYEITYKLVRLDSLCSFEKYFRAGIHKFVGDFTRVKSPTKLVKANLNSSICVSFENILECIHKFMGDFTRVKSSPNPSKHGKTSTSIKNSERLLLVFTHIVCRRPRQNAVDFTCAKSSRATPVLNTNLKIILDENLNTL